MKKSSFQITALTLAALIGSAFVYAACSDDDTVTEPTPDGGIGATSSGGTSGTTTPNGDSGTTLNPDGGTLPDGAPADCVQNPTTYLEIINACTKSDRLDPHPVLDKVFPDGGLPKPS